jgi:hypothetical protein
MHPRTEEVLAHLAFHRAALERAVAEVPSTLRSQRPAPDCWSVAEILEHLAIVEGRISTLLANHLDAARTAGLGREQETGPVVPTLDVTRLLDRTRKIVASEASLPRERIDADAALAALARTRDALRATILAADGLAIGTITAPHPVLGPLDAYQWLVFVGGHEARHTLQIRETGAAVQR